MSELRRDELQHQTKPKPRTNLLLLVAGVGCGMLIWLGIKSLSELDPIIEPTPAQMEFPPTAEQRAAVSSKVRDLLERIEAGKVSGKMASDFEVLAEADKINGGKQFRTYWFSLDGHTGELEGHPVIYVQVQLKTGRIIHCGVGTPVW